MYLKRVTTADEDDTTPDVCPAGEPDPCNIPINIDPGAFRIGQSADILQPGDMTTRDPLLSSHRTEAVIGIVFIVALVVAALSFWLAFDERPRSRIQAWYQRYQRTSSTGDGGMGEGGPEMEDAGGASTVQRTTSDNTEIGAKPDTASVAPSTQSEKASIGQHSMQERPRSKRPPLARPPSRSPLSQIVIDTVPFAQGFQKEQSND